MLEGPSESAAPRLLGCELECEIDGGIACVRIVETEAYSETDAASHSYRGRTPRTDVMFGPAGHLYVYFTYGMHYCMNVVCGPAGEGAAVLIRAVQPVDELSERLLQINRRNKTGVELTNGPAKLCQALGVDKTMNGHDLRAPPLRLVIKPSIALAQTVQTTRIGITQARDALRRFYECGNPYVSRPSS